MKSLLTSETNLQNRHKNNNNGSNPNKTFSNIVAKYLETVASTVFYCFVLKTSVLVVVVAV